MVRRDRFFLIFAPAGVAFRAFRFTNEPFTSFYDMNKSVMTMKRILCLLAVVLLSVWQGEAVLKEKDLSRTLSVLRGEMAADYERMQHYMTMYEQQSAQQHKQLVDYMNRCEQIGLILYSQSTDNTFDMAYACQQATSLFRELHGQSGNMLPYNKILTNMQREVDRYDRLIKSLKAMPPQIVEQGDSVTAADSAATIVYQAIDSLSQVNDSLRAARDSVRRADSLSGKTAAGTDAPKKQKKEEEEEDTEPVYLSGQELKDRQACLDYALSMHEMLTKFHDSMAAEASYYEAVQTKVKELNKFARNRYEILKDNIFVNGGDNYFTILRSLPRQLQSARVSIQQKYMPLEGHSVGYSEWRGTYVLFMSVFLIVYLAAALLLSYAVLRWLLPRKWRGPSFHLRLQMLSIIVGIALFAVAVMVVRARVSRSFIQMGTGIIINMAWLMEAIFLSLYVRLKGEQMRHAAAVYTPLMAMAFIVILFRVVFIPNSIVNLIYPPILLVFALWQTVVARRHAGSLPTLDRAYTHLTTIVIAVSTVMSWVGYTLMAVQVMIWWTFQLAAITTVTCIYDLMQAYELSHLLPRLAPALRRGDLPDKERAELTRSTLRDMKRGKHFTRTWFYDLVRTVVVPLLAVISVLLSILWAGSSFEMTDPFIELWHRPFINQEGLIRVSLETLCVVAALWFVFRYVNYACYHLYANYRHLTLRPGQTLNTTLARNLIATLTWGLFAVIALVAFQVPSSGISIVSAGLATGVGFAMQSIIENFFYGLQLMTGRLRLGDYIECDGITGRVDNISYQATQIVTADGCVIAFMNSSLFSKNFKNLTRNHRYELIKIPVGVAYGTSVDHARGVILDAIRPLCQQRTASGQHITNPATTPSVVLSDFGDSSVDLTVVVWMLVEEKVGLTARCREAIYNALNTAGIEIPFPQRDVHVITSAGQ